MYGSKMTINKDMLLLKKKYFNPNKLILKENCRHVDYLVCKNKNTQIILKAYCKGKYIL